MQSYKSYYMVSPQTVFTYPFHHAKLQILLHGVTANSLCLSVSPCKATNLTTWCHHKQSFRMNAKLIAFSLLSHLMTQWSEPKLSQVDYRLCFLLQMMKILNGEQYIPRSISSGSTSSAEKSTTKSMPTISMSSDIGYMSSHSLAYKLTPSPSNSAAGES